MKIICIGKNYLKHVKEMESKVPTKPVFFLKPETAKLTNGKPFFHPEFSENIHYEAEIVLKINKVGKHIERKFAHRYYDEIGMGIDFTARDLQANCKKNGLPWEIAKAFDNSAPLGKFTNKSKIKNINTLNFQLFKNDKEVQHGNTENMIFDFDTIISYVSQFFTLKIGDLIFTGTPDGVGKVKPGDNLRGLIEGEEFINFNVK
ncbi:MAG: fumarylacetoacetate hydrolase family protein [Bacteroidota bacterium]|nr:fumarylacetoacetate hydrolase family protein [Bacteroidota bacterium]